MKWLLWLLVAALCAAVLIGGAVVWLYGYLTGPGARIFPEWMYRRKTK